MASSEEPRLQRNPSIIEDHAATAMTSSLSTSSLRTYLTSIRRLLFNPGSSSPSPSKTKITLVSGNPSADLDSFVSAVVFSYFRNRHSQSSSSQNGRIYVPIINLSTVSSADLWRLRPEFGVALRGAISPTALSEPATREDANGGESIKADKQILNQLVTLKDILTSESPTTSCQEIRDVFSSSRSPSQKQDVVLVDHNAPAFSVPVTSDKSPSAQDINSRLEIVGCIDHHVNENVVPQDVRPRIITTGIGSCTSLVVKYLRDEGLWPSSPSQSATPHDPETQNTTAEINSRIDANGQDSLLELSILSLAPILIDTNNLRAKGDKCSDLDREVVSFLERQIQSFYPAVSSSTTNNDSSVKPDNFEREKFFTALSDAKYNSLNLLTVPEILDRDYKEFTESASSSSREVKIGMSSLARSVSWLSGGHGSNDGDDSDKGEQRKKESLVDEILSFTRDASRGLSVYAFLTMTGDGKKELGLFDLRSFSHSGNNEGNGEGGLIQIFEERAEKELNGLDRWSGDGDGVGGEKGETKGLIGEIEEKIGQRGKIWEVWYLCNTNMSRKQVAPLLRDVVRNL